MNQYFLPNEKESEYLSKLADAFDEEYTYIRLTKTMIEKSIIDASDGIRYLLQKGEIADYANLNQGDKIIGKAVIFYQGEIIEKKVSYYRPKTKSGDPRFWVYALTKYATTGDLVYFTILNKNLIVLPLSAVEGQLENFTQFAKKYSGETEILTLLQKKLGELKTSGWIQSVSPLVDNPKDVGDTLEAALGIQVNNLKTPDFMGKIEVKAKRSKAKTLDTLFGKVPDWEISNYKSVLSIVERFGYISEGYPMKRLYNDIKSSPNTQGLYSFPDDKTGKLFQKYQKNNQEEEVCAWWYSTIRKALNTKHP
ncbi:MAG: MvaI/BcnI family restriction endonuclease, partial [Saprospiraceae bacterium]